MIDTVDEIKYFVEQIQFHKNKLPVKQKQQRGSSEEIRTKCVSGEKIFHM